MNLILYIMAHHWTIAELKKVEKMAQMRCQNKEIAVAIGVSESQVRAFKYRNGIFHPLGTYRCAEKRREWQRNYYWRNKNAK